MLNKKPMILCLAGPNGSGKSTITQYFEKVGTYTNADDVVAVTGMSNEEAAAFVDRKRYASIAAKEDFTFETVLSSGYKLDILHVYDNTTEPVRIIRKHKESISIFPNQIWTEDKLLELIGF